jgi:hypothetical protein
MTLPYKPWETAEGIKGENIEEIYEKGKGEVVWRCRVDETLPNHPPFPELDSFFVKTFLIITTRG